MVNTMLEAVPTGKRRLTGLMYALIAITLPEMTHQVASVVKSVDSGGLSVAAGSAIIGVTAGYFVSKFGEKSGGN